MTAQDDMIANLVTYMSTVQSPLGGYPVIDLHINHSSRSPLDVLNLVGATLRDEADLEGPNGEDGYVAAERNKDIASNTMMFYGIGFSSSSIANDIRVLVQDAFSGEDYTTYPFPSIQICDSGNAYGRAVIVTYVGSE